MTDPTGAPEPGTARQRPSDGPDDASGSERTQAFDRPERRDHDAVTGEWGSDPDSAGIPARGWGDVPPAAYEAVHSGGWGTPEAVHVTGPLPRLRRPTEEQTQPVSPPPRPAPPFDPPAERRAAAPSTPPAEPPPRVGEPEPEATTSDARGPWAAGLSGLTDLRFRRRATTLLAPVAYPCVVAYLVLSYLVDCVTALVDGDSVAAVLTVLVVGLLRVVAGAVVTRLLLEVCVNVAELARARRT